MLDVRLAHMSPGEAVLESNHSLWRLTDPKSYSVSVSSEPWTAADACSTCRT